MLSLCVLTTLCGSALLLLIGVSPLPQLFAIVSTLYVGRRQGTPITVALLILGLHLPTACVALLFPVTSTVRMPLGIGLAVMIMTIGVSIARQRSPLARSDDRRTLPRRKAL